MKVVAFNKPAVKKLPEDTAGKLRAMADDVDSGKVTELVVAFIREGEYAFLWPSSLANSVVLTSLAAHIAVENMKE